MNQTDTETDTKQATDFPSLWGVRFMNDDFTPMDYVIFVLTTVFKLSVEEAVAITMKVHNDGDAIVGAYPKDIAMTKADIATRDARANGHPLRLKAVEV